MKTENLNNIKNIIGNMENYEIKLNNDFGNSYMKFKMDNDCFKCYDYDKEVSDKFERLIENNLNEEFDIVYYVYNKEFKYNDGLIIGNVKTGEIFDDYIFSMMELDENTN